MFLGEFDHSLDDKHRVVLSSPLRRGVPQEVLDRGFVVVPNATDECLELYPMDQWERRIEDLERTHDVHRSEDARDFFRSYVGRAARVQCDTQGRFLLPEQSRRAVGIERDVRFVGMVRFIEIWAAERWEERAKTKGKRTKR